MTALVPRRLPEASPGAVDRAMRALGLAGVLRAKGLRTTIPAKDGKRAGDLQDRDFTAAAPNRTWVMGITQVRTWEGSPTSPSWWIFAHRIVAWHVGGSMHTELVMVPLRTALWQRDREGRPATAGELIAHSNAGSQCTSGHFTEHLALEGIQPSIGSIGDANDNALMGCVIGLSKTECLRTTVFHTGPFKTIADVEFAPPAGSGGTTTPACTVPSAISRPSSASWG